MTRYNRINLGGRSVTHTALVDDAFSSGQVAGAIASLSADGKFVDYDNTSQPFALNGGGLMGVGADQNLDYSATGEYLLSGRLLAVRASAGTYHIGQPLTIGSGALVAGTTDVIAYANENVTLTEPDLLAVYIK